VLGCRAGRREARRLLSHGDGHLGRGEERFIKGRPGRLLLAQLLLQPLEKLLGCFLLAQLAEAAEQAVVQGGLQQRMGENRFWRGRGSRGEGRADAKVSPAPSVPTAPGQGVARTAPKGQHASLVCPAPTPGCPTSSTKAAKKLSTAMPSSSSLKFKSLMPCSFSRVLGKPSG